MISATTNFDYNLPCPWLSLWWKMRNGKLIPRCAAREGLSENPEDLHMTFSADNRAWEFSYFAIRSWDREILVRFFKALNYKSRHSVFLHHSQPSGYQHKHTQDKINSAAWLHSIQSSPLRPSILSPLTILFNMALQEWVSKQSQKISINLANTVMI